MKKKHLGLGCPLWIIILAAVIVPVMIACKNEASVDDSQYYLATPTEVTVTLLSSDNAIHLTWNAVPNTSYYEIDFRTNLDSADTRRSGTTANTTMTYFEYSWWYDGWYEADPYVTTLYFYIKAHPSKSGYIESGWSDPVSVTIR